MHTWLKIGNDNVGEIGMHDRMPDKNCSYGDGVSVSVGFGNANVAKTAFDILKEGSANAFAMEDVGFCEYYGTVTDRFGVNWILMY